MKTIIKTLGVLFFLAALLHLYGLFLVMNTKEINTLLIELINVAVYGAVGCGLFKMKLWAVYGTGVMVLADIFTTLHNNSVGRPLTFFVVGPIVFHIILLVWFYSIRKSFSK